MLALSWWVYLVLAGIIFSAIMVIKTAAEERKIEQFYIEKEGNVYLQRIEEEKEKRRERQVGSY